MRRINKETIAGALLIISFIGLFASIMLKDNRKDCPDGSISKRINFCKNESSKIEVSL